MDKITLANNINELGTDHEYMSNQHYTLFDAHIRYELAIMLKSQQEAKSAFKASERHAPDPVDKATLDEEKETHLRRASNLDSNIRKATDALRAIKLEEYGFCQDCGAEIGIPRLLSNPFALRDMECERAHEIKSKQLRGAKLKIN